MIKYKNFIPQQIILSIYHQFYSYLHAQKQNKPFLNESVRTLMKI